MLDRLKLNIVEERKSIFEIFTYGRLLGGFFFVLAIPTFFILPFLDKNQIYWYLPFLSVLAISFFLGWIMMLVKYCFKFDYNNIGEIFISKNNIDINVDQKLETIELDNINFKILYNGIRNRGFHFLKRDYPRNGISVLIVNNERLIKVLITNESELQKLKLFLKSWYKSGYNISEFTRTKEEYRLIELESKFDWEKLIKITKH